MTHPLSPVIFGLQEASSLGNGTEIYLNWTKMYPDLSSNKLAYNIYYSIFGADVVSEGTKFITDGYEATIKDLSPGTVYHFLVRPFEYDNFITSYDDLITAYDNLKIPPTSVLRSNISEISTIIPMVDVSEFPTSGIIKIGKELVNYLSKDSLNNNLVLSSTAQRGYNNTTATIHNTDGFDGYEYLNTNISLYFKEDRNYDKVVVCQSRFEFAEYAYTATDGYKQTIQDNLTTDLTSSDEYNQDFNSYDGVGWHRTDPVLLLNGGCVGSYIGGQQFCADGYSGVGRVLRGLSVQEQSNQRLEQQLVLTGEPIVLLKRNWTGIRCACFLPNREYPEERCPKCYGTGYVLGYEQYHNPGMYYRSDGRILMRASPAEDDVKNTDSGLESEFSTEFWTLTVPTIKDRDIIVRYDQDDNEEFRYEVISVTRNKLLNRLMGAQKFRVQRIRKTDIAYQIPVRTNTSKFPEKINLGIASGPHILPHTHKIIVNENGGFVQLTEVAQGHNHSIKLVNGNLIVENVLGHVHSLL
jgi:hypothetical protein